MEPGLVGLLVVAAVALCGAWVYQDARARSERRRPVVAVLLGYTIDEPLTWAGLCLVALAVFLPLYLVARRVDG